MYAMDKGIVCPFAVEAYPIGHHLTNFDAWKTAAGDYLVQHEFKCGRLWGRGRGSPGPAVAGRSA